MSVKAALRKHHIKLGVGVGHESGHILTVILHLSAKHLLAAAPERYIEQHALIETELKKIDAEVSKFNY